MLGLLSLGRLAGARGYLALSLALFLEKVLLGLFSQGFVKIFADLEFQSKLELFLAVVSTALPRQVLAYCTIVLELVV